MSNSIKCPHCNVGLIDLSSMNMRVCGGCHREYEWKLKPGQKSVLIEGLRGGSSMVEHETRLDLQPAKQDKPDTS